MRLNDKLVSEMRVLAAGGGLAYVATDEGLYIRSLENGAAVAEPDAIEGIGDTFIANMGSYDYDAEREPVVAIDTAGTVYAIPLGESSASEADPETTASWRPVLGEHRSVHDFPTTGDRARIPDRTTLGFEPTAPGAQTRSSIVSADIDPVAALEGISRRLGDATFFDPAIVLGGSSVRPLAVDDMRDRCASEPLACELADMEPEALKTLLQAGALPAIVGGPDGAAGTDAGYALVAHRTSANRDEHAISSVSLSTGEVIDTIEAGSEVGVGVAAGESTILTAREFIAEKGQLIVASPEGALSSFEVGRTNLIGMPW